MAKKSGSLKSTKGLVKADRVPRRAKAWRPKGSFRFLDLPSELRNRIYEFVLIVPHVLDLDPHNYRRLAPRLNIFQTCRQVYEEAYTVFYSNHTFRLFPTHHVFLDSDKLPVLTSIPRHYRQVLNSIELRLGPGWSKPPNCQYMVNRLGLKDCKAVKEIKVFVQVDPSHPIFNGYRVDDTFYTRFSSTLVERILRQLPSTCVVEFDAWPSVKKQDPLMSALLQVVRSAGNRIKWGPERGWAEDETLQQEVQQLGSDLKWLSVSA